MEYLKIKLNIVEKTRIEKMQEKMNEIIKALKPVENFKALHKMKPELEKIDVRYTKENNKYNGQCDICFHFYIDKEYESIKWCDAKIENVKDIIDWLENELPKYSYSNKEVYTLKLREFLESCFYYEMHENELENHKKNVIAKLNEAISEVKKLKK